MKKTYMLLLLILTWPLQAETKWNSVKNKKDIQIYSLQKSNYKLKHHKAVTQIPKNVETILAALQDIEACPEWVHNCISNRMVDMIDVRKRIYHTTIDSPLWFKDRDFYLQSNVTYQPQEKAFTINLTSVPAYAMNDSDTVRISDVNMIWRLERTDDQLTTVTYEVYIDPQLPIKSINHQVIKRSIFATIEGLRRQVKKPLYKTDDYTQSELEMLLE